MVGPSMSLIVFLILSLLSSPFGDFVHKSRPALAPPLLAGSTVFLQQRQPRIGHSGCPLITDRPCDSGRTILKSMQSRYPWKTSCPCRTCI
ncbi:hypothetical protein C8R46DRAFT_482719 [Mycena filopes]|nr:hypothetical protein C8R46DRAFT_482719 [Mycena filopes]